MRDVYIVGSYATPFGKKPRETFRDLTREVVLGAVEDVGAGLTGTDIESIWFGNVLMNFWGQHSTRGQFACIPLIQDGTLPRRVPITNVEGACATGSMAFQGALRDIRSGEYDVSIAIGVEKIYREKATAHETFEMFRVAENVLDPQETLDEYDAIMGAMGRTFERGPDRTMFMDTYAAQAIYHMETFGTTQRQLAAVAAKNHSAAVDNPRAQYRFPMTVDEVLADRFVTHPFTRSMCAPIGDGAAATVLVSADRLASLPPAVRARAVRVAASTLTSGIYRSPDEPSLSHVAARRAYEQAGIAPAAIDVAEVHDATAFSEIYQAEMMGFCPIGEGGAFAEAGESAIGGSIPINTSGGLISKGHPIAASGLSMIAEVVEQVRGESGPRQVVGARTGLIENGGGIMGLEEAACAVTILERA
ncbi:thiolase family protein [Salinibacterium sp. ZJ454]|uniref:thiolase family protein n=1 Tax=Salinibacterium sp. ZJ454 TaxID=2708339 RepID=UPI001AB04BA8|nr:thiolase family protein [Salinibacterium sp. ZJ454]